MCWVINDMLTVFHNVCLLSPLPIPTRSLSHNNFKHCAKGNVTPLPYGPVSFSAYTSIHKMFYASHDSRSLILENVKNGDGTRAVSLRAVAVESAVHSGCGHLFRVESEMSSTRHKPILKCRDLKHVTTIRFVPFSLETNSYITAP